jgi:hypothetical protein
MVDKAEYNAKLEELAAEHRAVQERMFDGAPPPPAPEKTTKKRTRTAGDTSK